MKELSEHRQNQIDMILTACSTMDQARITKTANGLAKIASNHMLSAFEFSYRQIDREAPSQLLLCVGTELLLNAIAILHLPKEYVHLCGNKHTPPSFEKIKNCTKPLIVNEFTKMQKDRMQDVLDLIQSKRNIFVHFSLGIHAYYYQHYEMLNALCYLFSRFFPQLSSEIGTIQNIKERFRMKNVDNYDYVDFPKQNFC
jgi:hypothetical protein